jgi:hypothetical protein
VSNLHATRCGEKLAVDYTRVRAPQIKSQKMIGSSPNSSIPATLSTPLSYCGNSKVVNELVT